MASFNLGETVICSCEVKDSSGNLKDPDTSITITINRESGNFINVIAATAMTKDSVGKYHYDFDSTSQTIGKYSVSYIATDSNRITIEKEKFDLV